MNIFKRVLAYADEHRGKLKKALFLIALSVIIEIIPYLLTYHLIMGFIVRQDITVSYLMMISLGILVTLWLKTKFLTMGLGASHEVAFDTLMGMRKTFSQKLFHMPLGDIQNKGTGSFKKHLVDDIEGMEAILAHMVPEGIPYLLSPLVVFITLLIVDYRMALLSLASIPFGIVAVFLMMALGMKKIDNYYGSEKKMNNVIIEYITGMEVIKIFNRTTNSYEKFRSSVENYRNFTLDWFRSSWTFMAMYGAILPCTIMFMLPVGIHFYLNGTIELATLVFSLMIAMSIGVPLIKLVEFIPIIPNLSFKLNALENVFNMNQLKTGTMKPEHYDVTFKDVTFAYEEVDVLKNINFKIDNNSLTAIVGESGSGKSTLAKLLLHFWDIEKGSIQVGGVDIRDISMDALMEAMSYVSQDNFLFDITLMENIRIGRPVATDEEVIEAAKAAQCHDFIMKSPEGYQTSAGNAGNKLSGGEIQRITIARAILKDAPIIVLDEATSYTDSENEDKIQEALNQLISNKTVIIIAHRLSTIVEADQIIVMDEGHLVAKGQHEKLLQTCEHYKKLWDAHIKTIDWDIQVKEDQDATDHQTITQVIR